MGKWALGRPSLAPVHPHPRNVMPSYSGDPPHSYGIKEEAQN